MSCLDRFLVSVDWESKFSKAVQRCLPRPTSDHSPILVDSDEIRTGPSPFRFELMWLKYEGFKETLKGWWQSLVFHSSFSFILAAKLKGLKGILKVWSREVFGRVESNKLEALWRVSYWDDLEKEKELGLEEHRKEPRPKMILIVVLSWRRSPGDRNPEKPG